MKSLYQRGVGWVKNVGNFIDRHPLLMATSGLVGTALTYAAMGPSLPPSRGQSLGVRNEVRNMPRREAVASSNTFSERPVLLGNMRGI